MFILNALKAIGWIKTSVMRLRCVKCPEYVYILGKINEYQRSKIQPNGRKAALLLYFKDTNVPLLNYIMLGNLYLFAAAVSVMEL